jgi:hypothetical protein
MIDMIDGEQAYVIWEVQLKWSQDIPKDRCLLPAQIEGLPEGRMWDHAKWFAMPKTKVEDSLEEIARAVMEGQWSDIQDEGGFWNPSDPKIEATIVHQEVWCPNMFSHWTWDIGQSDEEALASFNRFAVRHNDKYCPEETRLIWHVYRDRDIITIGL